MTSAIIDLFGLTWTSGFRGRVLALVVCMLGSRGLCAQEHAAPIPPPPADKS